MTRLIDADKLYSDCLTKNGRLAISQNQIANAPTVERTHGKCKDCKQYSPYRGQFYYEPKKEGICRIARMTPEGELNINVSEDFYCSYFEEKEKEQ